MVERHPGHLRESGTADASRERPLAEEAMSTVRSHLDHGQEASSAGHNTRGRSTPYRSSPVFDETTLPIALRERHRTKMGVWGRVEILEGRAMLCFEGGRPTQMLAVGLPGCVEPQEWHRIELTGPVRLRIDFYDRETCA